MPTTSNCGNHEWNKIRKVKNKIEMSLAINVAYREIIHIFIFLKIYVKTKFYVSEFNLGHI